MAPRAAAQTGADFHIAIDSARDPVAAGEESRYAVDVYNHGPAAAQGVTFRVTLPSGATFRRVHLAAGAVCAGSGATVTCTAASLPSPRSRRPSSSSSSRRPPEGSWRPSKS